MVTTTSIPEKLRKPVANIFMEAISTLRDLDKLHEKGVKGIDRNAIAKASNGHGQKNGKKTLTILTDFLSYFQVQSVKLLLKIHRILIADEMGVGKTAQAIAGKLEIENSTGKKVRAYVICPNSAREDVWPPRIGEYCTPDRRGEILVVRNYSKEEMKRMAKTDWVLLNYESLARTGNPNHGPSKFFKAMLKQMDRDKKNGVICYVVMDEVHNAKNYKEGKPLPENVIRLSREADYLCTLSGTPVPNWLRDIFILMAILRPDLFDYDPAKAAAAFREDPAIIRAVFKSCSLRRMQKDVEKLLALKDRVTWVKLGANQKRIYDWIHGDFTLPGGLKLQLLKKALLDPALIHPKFLGPLAGLAQKVEPAKYIEFDKVVNEICVKRGEKLVLFSPLFRKGVFDRLEKRYAHLGVVRLDATVSNHNGNRKRAIERFQKDPDIHICIANDVVAEGISLTAATRGDFLDNPYAPGERGQFITRIHRRGQKKKVTINTFAVKGTVDEGTIEFLRLKSEAIKILIDDGKMPDRLHYETLISASDSQVHQKFIHSPQQKLALLAGQLAGKGYNKILKGMKESDWEFAKQYADNYVKEWEGSFSYNVGAACKKVILGLEKERKKTFGKILDLGGAFGVLSYILNRSTTVTDINPKHLKTDFYQKNIKKLGNKFHLLPYHELAKIWTGNFDLVCASLGLHQCKGEGKESERVKALREMHRVLKDKGIAIIAFPLHTVGEDYRKFIKGVEKIGFKAVIHLSGVLESSQPEEIGLKCLFIVIEKQKARKTKVSLELACDGQIAGQKKYKVHPIKRSGIVKSFTIDKRPLE